MVALPRASEMDRSTLRLVVMGVSGCGKTAVASGLGQWLQLPWTDADDLHSKEAVSRMKAGIALTDEDRWPWLDRVAQSLNSVAASGRNGGNIVACSALKRSYRDHLRARCLGLQFLFLDADRQALVSRLATRVGHYMPATLLDSQLATLDRPGADEADVMAISVDGSRDAVLRRALTALGARTSRETVQPPGAPE